MRKLTAAAGVIFLAAAIAAGCGNSKKASEATTEAKAEIENITVDYGKGLNKDGTLANVDPKSCVTVCDYDGIKIKKEDITATDDEIQSQIDVLISGYQTTNEIKDRAVEDGDVVNIDYTGKVDGKEFEGGSAKGFDLTIGSGTFVDNFEEQLIGHNPGETVEVKVTFPENYTKELAGKEAVFSVVINYISEKQKPELNDEFVKENLEEQYGYTSVKDLKKDIKKNLEMDKRRKYVSDYLMDNSTFKEIPEDLVNDQVDLVINDMKSRMQAQGYKFEDYLKSYGYKDEESLKKTVYDTCKETVKRYLIEDVIAGEQNITVTEDDVKEFFNGKDYSETLEMFSESYINRAVLGSLVVDYVIDHAKVG